MDWEEAFAASKSDNGYNEGEWIQNIDEVVEDARQLLKGVRELEYDEYMETSSWKLVREQVFERDNNICIDCEKAKATDCHHESYRNFGRAGYKEVKDCVSLCDYCHKSRHGNTLYKKIGKARVVYDSRKHKKKKKKKEIIKNDKYKQRKL